MEPSGNFANYTEAASFRDLANPECDILDQGQSSGNPKKICDEQERFFVKDLMISMEKKT